MRVLGIGDGFNAGVALVEDGVVRFAVNEERLSRIKNHSGYYHGFPYASIELAFRAGGWSADSIDQVAVSNFAFPPLPLRVLALSRARPLGDTEFLDQHEFSQTVNSRLYSLVSERVPGSALGRSSTAVYGRLLRRQLQARFGLDRPITFVDHHRAHAASAYYTQPADDCLVLTMDCHGDGLSGSISLGSGGTLRRIHVFPAAHSLGSFYAAITNHLGFQHHRHEGKVTGLAAYGDPNVAAGDVARMISYDPQRRRLTNHLGRNQFINIRRIAAFFSRSYRREDVAAAAQRHLERIVLQIVTDFLAETGKRKVLLAGGVFGNVKLNQRINELPEVEYLAVHPGMGDEGLAVGAALAATAAAGPLAPRAVEDVFWGPGFDDREAEDAVRAAGFPYRREGDIDGVVAQLLAEKRIVARCDGRLEYGPRALGNRSILFHAGDPSVNDWLNKKLRRTEFMPFAPITLRAHGSRCYRKVESAAYSAAFMTVCFDCEPSFTQQCPAVVHVDGTARPQLVDERNQPALHRILTAYERRTGIASVINTSFNMHEEPIVCSPSDALRAFASAELDHLVVGSFLVSRNGSR
jgi:carbamoyltransferase